MVRVMRPPGFVQGEVVMAIVTPRNWQKIGQPVLLWEVEHQILSALADIDCTCLALSGGIDSTLLLHLLMKIGKRPTVFTATCSHDHPDIKFAKMAIDHFELVYGGRLAVNFQVYEGVTGNDLVRAFYADLHHHTDAIIAGDGIDELMGGYYAHQESPTEETYYDFLRRLLPEHLQPLDENSDGIKVHLPYLDERVTRLLWQIPLSEKVDATERKKLMVALARCNMLPNEIIERKKYGFGTKP